MTGQSVTTPHQKAEAESATYIHGIRANIGQFVQQLIQVFFVGLTIGLERNVIPALSETEFGVARGSYLLLMTFVVSFGMVKAAMNLLAGRLSEKVGRRKVLIWGWLAALPIPFMILYAPSWDWIVAANVALGVNQGFAWSMTVTSKIDITRAEERGLATGINEFAGYGGVAIAGVATGYLATLYEPRWSLFVFGLTVVLAALTTAYLFSAETIHWARAEAKAHKEGTYGAPAPRFPTNISPHPSMGEIFALVSYRHRTLAALSQAGCVEKFADALVWAFFPLYLAGRNRDLIEIGWIVGIYGMVWGLSQLWTGPLSDAVGRKRLIVAGMWICAGGIVSTIMVQGVLWWSLTASVAGLGMALLYPTLIAAVGDISRPEWRGTSLGVYRFWRDAGYAIGAFLIGIVATVTSSIESGFLFTALAMVLSGFWILIAAEETHPKINPATTKPDV